jgi:hypothetical protein
VVIQRNSEFERVHLQAFLILIRPRRLNERGARDINELLLVFLCLKATLEIGGIIELLSILFQSVRMTNKSTVRLLHDCFWGVIMLHLASNFESTSSVPESRNFAILTHYSHVIKSDPEFRNVTPSVQYDLCRH